MTTADPLIAVQHLTKRFPGVVALNDVSLDVRQGEVHAIVGENGAGKSTLMKCLAGVIADYEGAIRLRGSPVRFRGTADAARAGASMIHQELNLVESLSVAANLFLGREPVVAGLLLDESAMQREAVQWLARLDCTVDPREPVGRLRVGDQQLVEIAKALSLQAEILIMDEPTSALTETEADRLFRILDRLRQQGVTILYISHKLDEVFRLADRITVMRDGQVIRTLARQATTPREVTHLMVGRQIAESNEGTRPMPGKELLRVEDLWLPWPGHARQWRLQAVSLTLHEREVLGIAGLMGAGRTELLECLFGATQERPAGTIRLDGREVTFRRPSQAIAAGIALVTEDRKRLGIFENLDVARNMTIGRLDEAVSLGLIDPGQEAAMARSWVEQLGVRTSALDSPVTSLSGGNQQKAILGRWLMTRPKVLLLDDPTRGVDVGAKADLYELIGQLCRQGLGIILTSSELPELMTLSDRIVVLCEGRVTGELRREEATEQRIMELATMRGEGKEPQGRGDAENRKR